MSPASGTYGVGMSPLDDFLSCFEGGCDFVVAILGSNFGDELGEGRNPGSAAQFDMAVNGGFDLQRVAFFQLGILSNRFGDTHRQAVPHFTICACMRPPIPIW